MSDWRITISPSNKKTPDEMTRGGNTLEILSGDINDAIDALVGYAEAIEHNGFIPDTGMDFRSRSPAAVVRRVGQMCYQIRADCFEFETDDSYYDGYAYMRAEEVVE